MFGVVIVGAVGAGKTTLARKLAFRHLATRISVDDIRRRVTGSPTDWSVETWREVDRRLQTAQSSDRPFILDTTGLADVGLKMALRKVKWIPRYTISLTCSEDVWRVRESGRGRPDLYEMWRDSQTLALETQADLRVETDDLTQDDVADLVSEHLDPWVSRRRTPRVRLCSICNERATSSRHWYCDRCRGVAAGRHRRSSAERMGHIRKTTERGYGSHHRKVRAEWQVKLDSGEAIFCRNPECLHPGVPVNPHSWDLGHEEGQRGWRGPEHPDCNRGAPSRRRRKARPH